MKFPIEDYIPAIAELCRAYGVLKLEVFGSVCTEDFDLDRSDIDFLVEYPTDYDYGSWMVRVQDLESALAELLGHKVDLVMISALKKSWFRKEAAKTRKVIFDAREVADVA